MLEFDILLFITSITKLQQTPRYSTKANSVDFILLISLKFVILFKRFVNSVRINLN